MTTSAQNVAPDDKREFLRHTLATLAYRGGKALRDAPAGFAEFRTAETTRAPGQILAHIGDLLDWALSMARDKQEWHDSAPLKWEDGVRRFFVGTQALEDYLVSGRPLGVSVESLFQGPIADALTHVGQIRDAAAHGGIPGEGRELLQGRDCCGTSGRRTSSTETRV